MAIILWIIALACGLIVLFGGHVLHATDAQLLAVAVISLACLHALPRISLNR